MLNYESIFRITKRPPHKALGILICGAILADVYLFTVRDAMIEYFARRFHFQFSTGANVFPLLLEIIWMITVAYLWNAAFRPEGRIPKIRSSILIFSLGIIYPISVQEGENIGVLLFGTGSNIEYYSVVVSWMLLFVIPCFYAWACF